MPFPPIPNLPGAAPVPAPAPAPAPVVAELPPPTQTYRYVLGPNFAADFAAPVAVVAPAPLGKLDVAVVLVSTDNAAWTVTVSIPAYDLATHNQLVEVRAYLAPQGSTLPTDGPGWVASSNAVTTEDVSTVLAGGDDVISLPAVAPGSYLGQIVLGFIE